MEPSIPRRSRFRRQRAKNGGPRSGRNRALLNRSRLSGRCQDSSVTFGSGTGRSLPIDGARHDQGGHVEVLRFIRLGGWYLDVDVEPTRDFRFRANEE